MDILDSFVFVPLPDGRRLSARLLRPAVPGPVPAILEFAPYRTLDMFRGVHDMALPRWAAAGYAVLAIDIAGSGASSGVLRDEYLPGEIDDACAAIAWVAEQSWCNGAVGLSGFSWSAFTALRVAARKPAALKAMVLGGVSEDGWRTDIHYLGGALYTAQVDWAGVMQMFNALPPDPLQAGEGWRALWLERLEANRPWILPWLTNPAHDDYWTSKAAAVTGDVPLLLYGGFADKYTTSALRIAREWRGPLRTILGPWEHSLPHTASRGPRIGFPEEALRWWDRYLKGWNTGVEDDAPIRMWCGGPELGRWLALDRLADGAMTLCVNSDRLAKEPDALWHRLSHRALDNPVLGNDLYEDAPGAILLDAYRDAGALIALSEPLPGDVEFAPSASLSCECRGSGNLIARLIDIGPDGAATRVTTGALNVLSDGAVTIPLQAVAWTARAGHRIGLMLTASGWPTFWPKAGEISLRGIRLNLPLVPAQAGEATLRTPTKLPRGGMGIPRWLDPNGEAIAFAPMAGASVHNAGSAYHLEATGTDYLTASRFEVQSLPMDQAVAAKSYRVAFERPGWSIRIDTRLEVRSTPEAFAIRWTHMAKEGGKEVHCTERQAFVPRSIV
ncbi:MAG: CocE/NonD family hydrolase [Proteobacteria bacterium]|nr:CocE/NonD family hydrolase [Pseudomonadota bacterium]